MDMAQDEVVNKRYGPPKRKNANLIGKYEIILRKINEVIGIEKGYS